jgi:Ser/Thr protein kinase RdoA (MazF antagonist)
MVATLWAYLDSTQVSSAEASELSVSLKEAHRALQQTTAAVPDYRYWLDLFAASLFDDDEMSNLDTEGRNDLRTAYNELRERIDSYPRLSFRIHGDPHIGNFLRASNDLVLIDFETVCTGPPEWDLASLDASVAVLYPTTIDEELLRLLRIMNNVRVATWSFVNPTPAEHELGRRCLKLVRARRP